jgi:hypothetical protein
MKSIDEMLDQIADNNDKIGFLAKMLMKPETDEDKRQRAIVGSVWQIRENHDPGDGSRKGWVGAFVMCTDRKSWGIQGFVHHVVSHDTSSRAYIRLDWKDIDYIGVAELIPADEVEPDEE